MWLQGSLETLRASCWTRSTRNTNESLLKRVSRSTKRPAWKAQEDFGVPAVLSSCPPTVELRLHSQFTADIKAPSSHLTAEVEWWHRSSRVPCSIHGILMAAKQRLQELELFLKTRAHFVLHCTTLACNHTHAVRTLDSYFLCFAGLF